METIRFFLASSTEGLEQERKLFPTIIKSISKDSNIDLEPWTWEEKRGRYTDPKNPIQSSINIELEKSSAVFFLFYNKIGKGVREEYNKACDLGIKCYFYQKKYALPIDASDDEANNFEELRRFLQELRKTDDTFYIIKYDDDDKKVAEVFQEQVKRDIALYISNDHLRPKIVEKPVSDLPVYDSRIKIEARFPINNHFVGRFDEMDELSRRISCNDIVAVYGMGGMGKTSLIAQYCKNHETEYDKIIWVPYHNNLQDSILALGANYSYQNSGKQLGFGEIVSSLNSAEGNKLIVFDNFDIDRDEINEKYNEIKQCFPSFKIIFTTRTDLSILDDEICVFNLIELKTEEAILLFKEYYRNELNDTQVSLNELSQFLDTVYNHTLIIELVAKTLYNHFTMTMREIIGYVRRENELEPLEPGRSIWADSKTWGRGGIAITDISTQLYNMDLLYEEERRLLEILAIICEEGIDVRFLMRVIAPENRRKFEDLVNRLSTNGWVNKTGFYVKCHRILAYIVLKKPEFDTNGINTLLGNLATMTAYDSLDDVAARKPYYQMQRLLLTYIRNNKLVDGISSKLVAYNAINFYYNGATLDVEKNNKQSQLSSDIEEKQSYQFLVYAKSQCEKNQLEICHINECLARIYRDYYRYDDALSVLNEAKRIEERVQDDGTLDKAKTFYELADLLYNYKDRGSMAIAVDYLNQSYNIYSSLLKEDCVENLNNCLLYIRIYRDLDSDEDVKIWTEKAQSIIEKSKVDEHNPLRIHYYIELSTVDTEKRLYYLDKAEELTHRLYGDNHPIFGIIAQYKINHFMENHNIEEANKCIDQWIHNDILNFGHNTYTDYYGDYYRLMVVFCSDIDDKWALFIDLYKKSACASVKNDGTSAFLSSTIRWCNQMMGIALYKTGQCEKALEYLSKAFDVLSKELISYDFGRTQELLNAVSVTTNKSNKFSSNLIGGDDVLTIVESMVRCLISLDRFADAHELLDKTVTKDYIVADAYSRRGFIRIKGEIELLSKQHEKAKCFFNESLLDANGKELIELILAVSDEYFYAIGVFKERADFKEVEKCYNELITLLESKKDIELQTSLVIAYHGLGFFLFDKDKEKERIVEVFGRALEIAGYIEDKDREEWAVLRVQIHMGMAMALLNSLETETDKFGKELTESSSQTVCKVLESARWHCNEIYKLIKEVDGSEIVEKIKECLNIDCIAIIGVALGEMGKYDNGVDLLQKALPLISEDNVAQLRSIHSNLAYLYKEKGELDKVEGHYRKLIAIMEGQGDEVSRHDLADTYDDLGVCLYQLGRSSEAVGILERALETVGNDDNQLIAAIRDHLAQVFRANDEFEKAECHYKESVKQLESIDGVPGDVIADRLMKVGVMLARQKKYDECMEVTERALSLVSEENVGLLRSIHSNLAYLFKEKGELDKAEEHYRKLIAILEGQGEEVSRHDLADAYDDLGACLYQLDRNSEAIESLEQALKIIGNDNTESQLIAAIHDHLAQTFRANDEYDKAELHYKECTKRLEGIKSVPGEIIIVHLLDIGMMMAKQEKYEECIEVTERALSMTSDEKVGLLLAIHTNLAYLYNKKDEHEKAERHYRERISLMEKQGEGVSLHDLADAYDGLGVCLFMLHKYDESKETLEYALKFVEENDDETKMTAVIRDHLAMVNRSNNDKEQA